MSPLRKAPALPLPLLLLLLPPQPLRLPPLLLHLLPPPPVLPVLRVNGQAAAAPGLGLDENFAPDRHETAARVIFYKDRGENV